MDITMVSSVLKYNGKRHPKIDLHAHFLPEAYLAALELQGEKDPDGFPTPAWSAEDHVRFMDKLGIDCSFLSISSPHINFGDRQQSALLAGKVNDFAAGLARAYPGRFGVTASLPVPYVEESVKEIRYCRKTLSVDGFALPTNSRGTYLGSDELTPVFSELNGIGAVVVLHPNKPGAVPEGVNEELPAPAMEFLFDTTRTITNMMLKGIFKRFPDINFVVPHAGAFLTLLADRLMPLLEMRGNMKKGTVFGTMERLYYDLAGFCLPRQLDNLLQIVSHEHLFYGSDTPYTPEMGCILLADALDKTTLLSDRQREDVYRNNAVKLFPRVAGAQ